LDVLLSQVLIEAVIMDVTLGSSFNLGVSAAQNPQQYGTTAGGPILGGGGGNNGAALQSLIPGGLANAATNGAFAQNLGGGLNYYGNIGPNWDVAVSALAGENNATVIQRPRIQTSQAKPATFFVGNTVPYVTGTYYGGGYSGGNSSQYSQLTVGVELDVTPFINPDGLVVMDINQEIDDVNGSTAIEGVGNVPNTDKRTLSSEIAVRDRDTIMLGGFIRSDKSTSKSGVPVLQDIPLLGMLFSSRSDSKNREELIVLMRPTVLKTLDDSAAMTRTEERRLPGVSAAALDDNNYEQQLIAAERKAEAKRARASGETNGFYEENHTILQTDRIGLGTNAPVIPPPDVMVITNMPTYHSDETVPPVTPAPAVPNQ
jgi:general secretion pathway protein D